MRIFLPGWLLILYTAKLIMLWRLRIQWVGVDRVPAGPVFLAAKHSSAFDIGILSSIVWGRRREAPYFQMGSFEGYPILGLITPVLKRLGAFCVMRPKDVRRVRTRREISNEAALEIMRRVNDDADRARASVFARGRLLIVFPEGTRDAAVLRPLPSAQEFETAHEAVAAGIPVTIMPVSIRFAPPRWWWRRVHVEVLPGFAPEPGGAEATRLRVEKALIEGWAKAATL